MSELLQKIRSRGYWKIVIHPGTFNEERVAEWSALLPILEKTFVRIKGWGFPHVDDSIPTEMGENWVGQEIDMGPLIQLWRFYQSGQFVQYSGMTTDWSKNVSTFSGWPSQWESDGVRHVLLDIREVMIRFMEIFEFASRLSSTEAGDDYMHLEIEVIGIENHLLRVSTNDKVDFFRGMVAPADKIPFKYDLHMLDLKSNTRELALKPAAELLGLFNWNPSIAILRDIQAEVLSPPLSRAGWV